MLFGMHQAMEQSYSQDWLITDCVLDGCAGAWTQDAYQGINLCCWFQMCPAQNVIIRNLDEDINSTDDQIYG